LAKRDHVEQYFLDKTFEATYGLWNALLTVNGILLSAFSLLITFITQINKTLLTIIIASCSLSIFLILWNYFTTKWHYIRIGKRLNSGSLNLSNDQRKNDIDKSYRRHKFIVLREYAVFFLLLLEIALVIVLVASI
jgi:hypothetical protein